MLCSYFFSSNIYIYIYISQVACPLWHVASMTASLYAVRSWAMRPARVIVVFILSVMSWLHLLLGRPLVLFPCTCPSNISFSSPSCLFTWPKYFSFLLMMVERSHPSYTEFLQYGVVSPFFCPWHPQDCSVAYSKAFIFRSDVLFIVHDSQPYVAIGNIRALRN